LRIRRTRPRSSHFRPADAPCRPPEPARLREIVDQPLDVAGSCDAIFSTCDAEDRSGVDYFFFRRLVFFFAATFFLFFAIAALLAMSGWRLKYSAVANRSALPSDYYSRKKIIVTPLDFVRGRRRPPPRAMRGAHARAVSWRKISRLRQFARKFFDVAEIPMN
jgi:hypothetical protein